MIYLVHVALISLAVICGSLGALLLKIGAVTLTGNVFSFAFFTQFIQNPYIVGGIVLYGIPSFIVIVLLRTMPVSLLQPALALTYVVTALLAYFVLSEPVPVTRWLGIIVIVVGVLLVAKGG